MAHVVFEHVSKAFPGSKGEITWAARDLSFAVEEGEFVVLVGPSGCGKTTTLRLLAGLEEPNSGIISLAGRVVNGLEPKDRDVAMVFQNYALFPHLSVFENLAFGLRLRKVPRTEIARRVRAAAEQVGLTAWLERRPSALSGGQRQRVAVGRAIIRQPQLFLFDEPLSNLDAPTRLELRREIKRLHKHLAATTLYVTHDQTEAMALGDRLVVMKEGAIQQIAAPLALYHQPANRFVAGFIGSPPMNFFRGSLGVEGGALRFRQVPGHEPNGPPGWLMPVAEAHRDRLAGAVGQRVVLGLRPEDVVLEDRDAAVADDGLSLRVELVEPSGAETFVQGNLGGDPCVARCDAARFPLAGMSWGVRLRRERAHYFDETSGRALL